jgi:hypothetical protein
VPEISRSDAWLHLEQAEQHALPHRYRARGLAKDNPELLNVAKDRAQYF